MQQLVLASHNQGKLEELGHLLGGQIRMRLVSEFDHTVPDENGLSFIENALIKARHAARVSGLPALADDSGLVVDALQGAPGIHSAHYSGARDDAANNAQLLSALQDIPEEARGARFVCVLALVRHSEDPLPIVCEGIWEGRILKAPQGQNGFGYDPIFWVSELQCASAELSAAQKSQLSHRARAIRLLQGSMSGL